MEDMKNLPEIGNGIRHKKEELSEHVKGGHVYRVNLGKGDSVLEAKEYLPEKKNGEIILVVPGLPGDYINIFEDTYVSTLIERGYAVTTLRRNGTVIKEENSNLINNESLLESEETEKYIGNKTNCSHEDWVKSIELTIKYYSDDYEKVNIVCHSLGVTESLQALISLGNQVDKDKVNSILSLSGSLGEISEDGNTIDPLSGMSMEDYKKYLEDLEKRDIISIDVNKTLQEFRDMNNNIHINIGDLDLKDKITFVCPVGDEVNSPLGSISINEKIGGGRILNYFSKTPKGKITHDCGQITSKTLLRLLSGDGYSENIKKITGYNKGKPISDEQKERMLKYHKKK